MSIANPFIVEHNMIIIGEIVQSVAVIIGVTLLAGGIFQLKKYGEMRTMMSHQMTLAGPVMMIVAAAALLSLPSFIDTAILSLTGNTSPFGFPGLLEPEYMNVVITFVRVVGVGSFIRGIVLLSRSGQQGGQPGHTGKALIHIVAGVMAVHIIGTFDLLGNIMDLW